MYRTFHGVGIWMGARGFLGPALALVALLPAAATLASQPPSALAPVEIWADGFLDLRGIAVDPSGHVFVADREAGTVSRIAPDRSRTIVATGLDRPIGLALDPAGRLLIAEERAGRVVRLESTGRLTTIVAGIKQPRWLTIGESGSLFISARRLTRNRDPEPDDESAEPEVILALGPTGQLSIFADGFRHLQGLAGGNGFLYAATTGRKETAGADGVIFQIPILPDGTAGVPSQLGPAESFKRPVGLVSDRLGALFLTTKDLTLSEDKSKRAIAKLHLDGSVTLFASDLKKPQGVAFDAEGNLFLADGNGGRVLRFGAPSPPTVTAPAFTNQSPVFVNGATEPNARADLFVNDAVIPVTGTSDASGAFSLTVPLTTNAENLLQLFATTHAGHGLTGPPAEAILTHDRLVPQVAFREPPAGVFIRQTVSVRADATDGGSGVASLALSAGQPLAATLTPAPPAPSLTATGAWDTTGVADGSHTLMAAAIDRAGNSATATRLVLVDNTPPDTQLSDGPSGVIAGAEATFSFTGTDNLTPTGNLSFAWSLDGGAFTPFGEATTATLTGLVEGTHAFQVKARDLAGNEDPTPASRSFTVSFGPVITEVNPQSGPVGTYVTISGLRFEPGAPRVAFNGAPAALYSATPTTLTTTVPPGATTGPLTVTTQKGTASQLFTVTTSGNFNLTVVPGVVRAIPGDQVSVSIQAGGNGTFTSLVSLALAEVPAGITASFSPSLVAPGSNADLTLSVAGTLAPGSYILTVTGQAQVDGQTLSRAARFTLELLAAETPAVTGHVLTAEAVPQPIPGVTVTLGAAFTLTDGAGNFLLPAPPAGANMLLVDGRTASTPTAQYPPVEVNLTVAPSGPTRVPFIVYLPKLDTAHPVTLPLDSVGVTTREVQATTVSIPGLVVTIPAGTRITGPDGNPVSQITLTPVSIDRSPMPFPPGVVAPLLFTIQPGGAVPSQPLPITFPNVQQAPPGSRADLYFFDLIAGNWAVWGTGTVSADGQSIVSDPGFGLPRFAWHFPFVSTALADQVRSRNAQGGDPVDLTTGRLSVTKTDLLLPGRLPVTIERTYRSENPRAGLLGIGWTLNSYDSVLTTAGTGLSLILADQSAYLLAPAGAGQWQNTTEPFLRGAVVTQLPGEFRFQIRFKDGVLHHYERIVGFANAAGLAAITDPNGNSVSITREALGLGLFGKITRITEPAGRALAFTYDSAGRIVTITDPLGRVVRYAYDSLGRLTAVTDAAGGVTGYTYDGSHRILTITDPRGLTFLTNEYDAQGRVIRQTQADGTVWAFAYTVTGGVVTETSVTDPRGTPTRYRFNSQGFTLSRTDGLGQTTAFEYEPGSNLLRSTMDPLGRTTRFSYDAQGNLTTISDPAGNTRAFAYEPTFNRVTSITDPLGQVTRFEYDAQGNPTAVTDPLGNRTTMAYNASGQPTSTTDPLGNATRFEYDAAGNLTASVDPLGNRATREYDAASRLISQTGPRGRVAAFAYDALNRLTQLTDALGGATRFSYDGNGNLLTMTDARGSVTTHAYDPMDRLASRADPVGASESFEYDGAGNLTRHTDRKGQVSIFGYDALNRRTGATYADGGTTTVGYDAIGRLTQTTDSVTGTILNIYDSLDRLVAQTTGLGTVSYQYDALGRRVSMSAPGQPLVSYAYDAASRLAQLVQGSQVVDLQYDAAGRRTRLTLPNQVSTEYTYDTAARLTELIYRSAASVLGNLTYRYDAAGNRTQVGGTFARTLLPDPVVSATYDPANRQLTFGDKALAYDASGNLSSLSDPSGLTTFTWDARNRLVGLTGPTTAASFLYDPLGRRVARQTNGQLTRYLYAGLNILQEITDQGTVAYFRSQNIDEPLARNGSEFYLADALGSILGLTDPGGSLTTRYVYEPFGRATADLGASSNPFQFTARENDGTELYYYRSRYYSPTLHRFVSEDPIGLIGGDANLYAYVLNNPLAFNDPTGELFQAAIGAGLGAFAGGLSAVMNGENVLVGAGIGAVSGVAAGFVGPAGAAAVNAIANGFTQYASGTPALDLNLTDIALAAGAGATGKFLTSALGGAGVPSALAQATTGMSFIPASTGVSLVVGKMVPLRFSNLPVPPLIPPHWLPFPPSFGDPSLGQPIGSFSRNQRLGGRK